MARYGYIVFHEQEKRKYKEKKYMDPDKTPFLLQLTEFEQDVELFKRYRFSSVGINYICDLVNELIKSESGRGNPIPTDIQVKLTLQYLASNDLQLNIGRQFDLSQKSVSSCIKAVCGALAENSQQFIRIPRDEGSIRKMKVDFYNYSKFPSTIGALDGTHIRIESPKGETEFGTTVERSYVNRKGFHSINTLALVDFRCRFLYANACWPGSAHDAYILRQSKLWTFFEENALYDSIILADSAFPIRTWLQTPYLNPETDAQKAFNYAHARARVRVEHAFGQFKKKWRINSTGNRLALSEIPNTIIACAVLHNIGIDLKQPEMPEDVGGAEVGEIQIDDPADEMPQQQQLVSERRKRMEGNNKRREITETHFVPR